MRDRITDFNPINPHGKLIAPSRTIREPLYHILAENVRGEEGAFGPCAPKEFLEPLLIAIKQNIINGSEKHIKSVRMTLATIEERIN